MNQLKQVNVKLSGMITEHLWLCNVVNADGKKDRNYKKQVLVFFTKPRYFQKDEIETVNVCIESRLIDLCASQNTQNLDKKDFFKTVVNAVYDESTVSHKAAFCNVPEGKQERAILLWLDILLEVGQSLEGCLCVGAVPHYRQRVVLPPSKLFNKDGDVPPLEEGEFVLIELVKSLDKLDTKWLVREVTTGLEGVIPFKDSRNKEAGSIIISKFKELTEAGMGVFVKPFKALNEKCEHHGKVVTVEKMKVNTMPGDGNYRFIVVSEGLYYGVRVAVDLRGEDAPEGKFDAQITARRGQWICVRPVQ